MGKPTKQRTKVCSASILVPEAGLEPARSLDRGIFLPTPGRPGLLQNSETVVVWTISSPLNSSRSTKGVGRIVSEGPTTASLLIACTEGFLPSHSISAIIGRGHDPAPFGSPGFPAYSPILLPVSQLERSQKNRRKLHCITRNHHSPCGSPLCLPIPPLGPSNSCRVPLSHPFLPGIRITSHSLLLQQIHRTHFFLQEIT